MIARESEGQMSGVKYPQVRVQLLGQDGNAMVIMAHVRRAMQRARIPHDEIDAYVKEAKSGDYDHLLAVTMRWVDVE